MEKKCEAHSNARKLSPNTDSGLHTHSWQAHEEFNAEGAIVIEAQDWRCGLSVGQAAAEFELFGRGRKTRDLKSSRFHISEPQSQKEIRENMIKMN